MLNRITIAGRVVFDPELRRTQNGKAVTTIRIACDRPKDGVDFFDVVAWNGCAENVARYMKKGCMVIADGRLVTREFEKDGKKRTAYEIHADSVFFMDRPEQKEDTKPQLLNRITIAGRVVFDPELRRTQNGKAVTTIRIACDRPKDGVDFFDVVAWNGCAENVARYMKKGRMVIADGRLVTREFEKDGKKRTAYEIHADSVFFMDRPEQKEDTKPQLTEQEDEDGELPF